LGTDNRVNKLVYLHGGAKSKVVFSNKNKICYPELFADGDLERDQGNGIAQITKSSPGFPILCNNRLPSPN